MVVPSPAMSEVFEATSRTICAPMFSSGSFSSIFLGHRHAVFGDGRAAEFFLENHVAALGAERHLHRIGQLVDAAQNRLTGIFAINNLFCCHIVSFRIFALASLRRWLRSAFQNAEDFVLAHDHVFCRHPA